MNRALSRTCRGLAAFLLVASSGCSTKEAAPQTRRTPGPIAATPSRNEVRACVDEVPWFPFTFRARSEEASLTGATTELVREAFRRRGLVLTIEPLPWKRCMLALRKGQFVITYDAIIGEERRDGFVFSKPLYAMPQIFYYVGSRYPQGLGLQPPAYISRFRVCGVLGYSYPGLLFDTALIDTQARSPSVMLDKLRAGRCDLAIGYERPFGESAERGELDLEGLLHAPIPGAPDLALGLMAARGSKRGAELVGMVDQVMAELRADGTYASIMKRFGVQRYGIDPGGPSPSATSSGTVAP